MTTGQAPRSRLREFWPELIVAGLCVLTAATGQIAGAFAIALVIGVGWAIGYRHRSLPLHGKVDRMTDSVGALLVEMKRDSDGTARPHLRLVRKDDPA
jgi:hypothetical protein